MRSIPAILAALLVMLTAARAETHLPWLKVGDDYYTNVTVIKVTATDINFMHSRGLANAKLKDLSPDLQKLFHYNSAKATDAQTKQVQANSQYVQQAVTAKPKTKPADQTSGSAEDDVEIHVPQLYAKSFLNAPAPAFIVDQWITPKPDLAGKFVLIDFWATWCGPCRKSIPHINGLYAKFKDKMAVVGLTDQSEEDIRKMTDPIIDYAIATDPQQRMLREVEVRGIPHAMLIDPKGVVRFEGMPGYLTEAGLERILAKYAN